MDADIPPKSNAFTRRRKALAVVRPAAYHRQVRRGGDASQLILRRDTATHTARPIGRHFRQWSDNRRNRETRFFFHTEKWENDHRNT
jgi:hypothetical protein